MGCSNLHRHGNFTFLLLLLVIVLPTLCHGNKVGYRHLQLGRDEILVDQIIPLEEKASRSEHVVEDKDKVRHSGKRGRLKENLTELKQDQLIENLFKMIDNLKRDLRKAQRSQAKDRAAMTTLEKKTEDYHKETIMSHAEVVQLRQIVSESFDRIKQLEDTSQDMGVNVEGLDFFKKEATRDLRRFREYKERAAKRFHQIEKSVERLEKHTVETNHTFKNLTQEIEILQNGQSDLRNITSIIHETVHNMTSQCCVPNIETQSGDSESTGSHDLTIPANKNRGYSEGRYESKRIREGEKKHLNNVIEIVEYGSGETRDEFLSQIEEKTNSLTGKVDPRDIYRENPVIEGSGETVFSNIEGSGELGSGAVDELIPVMDLSRFMEVKAFQQEILTRDETIQNLLEKNQNLSAKMSTIEERLASIQIGSFMQTLQESLVNFTQNVITLDQWQTSSTQIVNSTLNNQDQIFKVTGMILENTDKIKDLHWKLSNTEMHCDQQYRVLRIHIVGLNNSVEDIKEQLSSLKKRNHNHNRRPSYQPSYYGYQTSYFPKSGSTSNTVDENQSTTEHVNIQTLISKLDEVGLQIVYNQNRLGNLEVKVLNESLYQCQKKNQDVHQDTQIAQLEEMVKTTANGLASTHSYVRSVSKMLNEIESDIRVTYRRVRSNSANIETLRKLIPIMVSLRKEVKSFLFYLPSDCQEYYERGYRKSGAYVIHPIRAIKSSQVTCYFDQSGGWTVLQQRIDGSVNFKKNWTDYREGFGDPSSEYWIGNEIIYLLTSNKNYSLHIDMTDTAGNTWQATYKQFSVSLPSNKSTLSVSGFHGNISDSLSYSNNMGFSTVDNDNDASSTNCGYFYESGWWFKHCQSCNLNGRYDIGFLWFNLETNDWVQLKSSTMKIIPT